MEIRRWEFCNRDLQASVRVYASRLREEPPKLINIVVLTVLAHFDSSPQSIYFNTYPEEPLFVGAGSSTTGAT